MIEDSIEDRFAVDAILIQICDHVRMPHDVDGLIGGGDPDYYVVKATQIAREHPSDSHLSRLPHELLSHALMFTTEFKRALPGETSEDYVMAARFAEQAERFKDMGACMAIEVLMNDDNKTCSPWEEVKLFSTAFDTYMRELRNSMTRCDSFEKKEIARGASAREIEIIGRLREKIVREIIGVARRVIEVTEKKLPSSSTQQPVLNDEVIATYHRMLADFSKHWYLAIEKKGNGIFDSKKKEWKLKKKELKKTAAAHYELSYIPLSSLTRPTHPVILLGASNHSTFLYLVMKQHEKACEVVKKAFDDAISQLDTVCTEDSYRECTLIMQVMRDNLTLWTSDLEEEG